MGLSTVMNNLSYKYCPSNEQLNNSTVGQILEKTVKECGNKTAFVFSEQNLRKSYTELNNDVDDLAAGFMSLGLKRGDTVGIWAPNTYEWVLCQYATAKTGLILTTINPAYQSAELEFCLNRLECVALVTYEKFKTQDYYQLICNVAPDLENSDKQSLNLKRLPFLKHVIITADIAKKGTYTFDEVLQNGKPEHYQKAKLFASEVQFDDPLMVLFTSGTTGKPKGATLSHFNVVNNALNIGKGVNYHIKSPIICQQTPFFHCYGCIAGTLTSTIYKGTCVIPSIGYNPLNSMKCVPAEKCNVMYGTPTMYIDMLNSPEFDKNDYSTLEFGTVAGAVCVPELLKTIKIKFELKEALTMYGTTETSPLISQCSVNDPETIKLTSVGHTIPLTEMKIVNDKGQIVPLNQPGEICARGPNVFLGYWKEPERTREVLKGDRWYHTGDLGTMNEDGYLYIIGRIKDMIIRGGENIYPSEVEEFFLQHLDVADVQVVGVPDPRMGEEACAFIQLKPQRNVSECDLKLYCKGKISHFKIPKYIIFADIFPKTISGKVQKYKLRELAVAELKLA